MIDPEINLSWLINFQSQNIKSPLPINSGYAENSDFEKKLTDSQKILDEKKDTDENIFSSYMPCFNALLQIKDFSNISSIDNKLGADSNKTNTDNNSNRYIQIDAVKNSSSSQTDANLQNKSQNDSGVGGSKSQIGPAAQKVIQKLFEGNKAGISPLNLISSQELIKGIYEKTNIANIKSISSKIIDGAKLLKEGEKTEIIMDLKPEWLGSIILKISSDKGVLNINIFANENAKSLIDTSIAELEKALKGANLYIGNLQVSVGGQSQGKKNNSDRSHPEELMFLDLFKPEKTNSFFPENSVLQKFFGSMAENMIYSKI